MIGYTDIHNHALPNLDDGAQNKEETLQMLQLCYDEGIRRIVFTPHAKTGRYEHTKEQIRQRFEQVMEEVKKHKQLVELEYYLGNEIYYSSDCIEKLSENKLYTMADSTYVLVEFPVQMDFHSIKNALYELLSNGYQPILAHAERYECLINLFSHVEELVDMGIYLQVNTGTLLGSMGFRRKWFSRKLLSKEYITFLGTDTHDCMKRSPKMKRCIQYIKRKVNQDYAEALLIQNPLKMIKNQYI